MAKGLETAVPGTSFFHHIQAGQGFDPANHGIVQLFGQLVHGVQYPVDAHANQANLAFGFDVNVAGFLIKRIGKQMVDRIDNMLIRGRKTLPGGQGHDPFQIA